MTQNNAEPRATLNDPTAAIEDSKHHAIYDVVTITIEWSANEPIEHFGLGK